VTNLLTPKAQQEDQATSFDHPSTQNHNSQRGRTAQRNSNMAAEAIVDDKLSDRPTALAKRLSHALPSDWGGVRSHDCSAWALLTADADLSEFFAGHRRLGRDNLAAIGSLEDGNVLCW